MRVVSICRPTTFIGCVLALVSVPVMALDLTSEPNPILSDPSYLPSAQQLSGATTYQFSGTESARVLEQSLSYGIVGDVTVWASGSYTWTNEPRNIAPGLDAPTFSNRFDPIVGVTVRVLDERSFPINWDLSAAAPGLLDSAVSWQTRDLTILGRAGVYYANSNTDIDGLPVFAPFWAYFVQFQSQLHLTQALALNAGAKYTVPFEGPGDFRPNTVDFEAALGYSVLRDRLVLQAGYKQQWSGFSEFFPLSADHVFNIALLYAL
jgi:hypothetical protein